MGEQAQANRVETYPVQVVAAAIVDSLQAPTRLLVGQRSAPPALAGFWEFPGGKVEPGESCREALVRELQEELGVRVTLGGELAGPHPQGWVLNQKAAMRLWWAQIAQGNPLPLQDHHQLRWAPWDLSILELNWIPANRAIVNSMLLSAGKNPR